MIVHNNEQNTAVEKKLCLHCGKRGKHLLETVYKNIVLKATVNFK